MVIRWQGPAQHTDQGLVSPGDVIDTTGLGIPESAVSVWVRDGMAVEVKSKKQAAQAKNAVGQEE